jgi:alanine racemase
MSRIGFLTGDNNSTVVDEIVRISKLPYIEIEGIFSHFSTSDEYDDTYTRLQFSRFMNVVNLLEDKGVHIPIKHICNSAGIMMYPEMHLDMVRPGVILYGMYPSDEVDKSKLDLKPAMTLKSRVTHVKVVEPGRGVSYGKEYITDKVTKIATVPIGYADGYLRRLAREGKMIVRGQLVPIIGRICMDQCMIDVTNVHNIERGDEVILFSDEGITVDDLAKWLDTINYEVTCVIGKRIPRIYTKHGKAVKVLNYLM